MYQRCQLQVFFLLNVLEQVLLDFNGLQRVLGLGVELVAIWEDVVLVAGAVPLFMQPESHPGASFLHRLIGEDRSYQVIIRDVLLLDYVDIAGLRPLGEHIVIPNLLQKRREHRPIRGVRTRLSLLEVRVDNCRRDLVDCCGVEDRLDCRTAEHARDVAADSLVARVTDFSIMLI